MKAGDQSCKNGSAILLVATAARNFLIEELRYFGGGAYGQQLDVSYKDFQAFARDNKLKHSQPPFSLKMEPWPRKVYWVSSNFSFRTGMHNNFYWNYDRDIPMSYWVSY